MGQELRGGLLLPGNDLGLDGGLLSQQLWRRRLGGSRCSLLDHREWRLSGRLGSLWHLVGLGEESKAFNRCLPFSGRHKAERCEGFTPWPSVTEVASGIKSQIQGSFQPILLWSTTFFLLFICERMVEQMQAKTLRTRADAICFPGRTGAPG